ncbi:hypothetical protein F0562_007556 [Nyssa sinensis]|uniref:Disease resistance N-terminal domain-containing protein n=1 Tax=Nyssa sinensis TaxID=561372 RepID=A0A5J5A8F3_9ASTE|nr:hypothetical protein F0562_007556 [Nyssa sinensis]
MAESALPFALKRLTSLLNEEMKLLGRNRDVVECIRDELEPTVAFLRHADAMDPEHRPLCVKQALDIAFDIEVVYEEFMLRLAWHVVMEMDSMSRGLK